MALLEILPRFATRLSYRLDPGGARRSLFLVLARLSLMTALASMSSGCLIEDPPPYRQPLQTPPRLDLIGATPPIDQVIVARTGDPLEFKIPVVSEDAGDRLLGVLQLDMGSTDEDNNVSSSFARASTLDDLERILTVPWTVKSIDPGCHRFTLRVSHILNFTSIPNVADPKDVAEAYWWANLDPDPETASNTLVNCPLASSGGN